MGLALAFIVKFAVIISNVINQGVFGSSCSSHVSGQFPVLTMCNSSSASGSHLVIDTFDSASHGVTSCVCTGTVELSSASSGTVEVYPVGKIQAQPSGTGCGSAIAVISGDSTTEKPCQLYFTVDVKNNSKITVKWIVKREENVLSQYCILLQFSDLAGSSLSMSCEAAQSIGTETDATTTTDSTSTAHATTTTRNSPSPTPSSLTTTTLDSTKLSTQQEIATLTSSVTGGAGSTGTTTDGNKEEAIKDDNAVEIVAPAAGGGVLLIIIIIVVIAVCRRKKTSDDRLTKYKNENGQTGERGSNLQTNTSVNMRSKDQDGIIRNELYVSADETMLDEAMFDEENGKNSNNEYAQVQKKPKPKPRNKSLTKPGTELSTTSGDVYAEVNKPKFKQTEVDNSEASRYKNPDGLVYARVDIQGDNSSHTPPIIPSKRFSDSTPDQDRVVYSEVEVGTER